LNDFGFLHGLLKKFKPKKDRNSKRIRTNRSSILKHLKRNLQSSTKKIIRKKKIEYGLNKFDDPKRNTIINKEKIKHVNGKTIKEIETKTIERKKVEASNKLPLNKKNSRKRKLSNEFKLS
jgi:hypothetical protein